jgi:mitogen-activated protein kinase 1/3
VDPSPEQYNMQISLGFANLNEDFHLPSDWQLVKKLGKGAYGKVMEVMHRPTGRLYACKRFEHVFVNDQRARRLLREMTILKRLSHPCINKLICVLSPESLTAEANDFNDVYLIIRLADMDLKKLFKSSRFLDLYQVKSMIYDILCGLKYLHDSKIIHRDLKPGNILVNDDCTVQICDFGLARSMLGVYLKDVVEDEQGQESFQPKVDFQPVRRRRMVSHALEKKFDALPEMT